MNLNKTTLLAIFCSGVLITGCQSGKQETAAVKAIDTTNMDRVIKPGDDFFRYANGNWIKNHPVPDQYADYGAFVQLAEENREQLKSLVQEAAGANGAKGTVTQQIGDFYKSGMDSLAIEKAGVEPLKTDFEKISKLGNGAELAAYYADLHKRGTYPVFAAFQMPDARQSEMVVLNLYQGGLGLPEVEYYLDPSVQMAEIRNEYQKFIRTMLTLSGMEQTAAEKAASDVMSLETSLAKVSMGIEERRDPIATYNMKSIDELKKLAPNFDWSAYFSAMGLAKLDKVNVMMPNFFAGFSKLLTEVPAATWQNYFRYTLMIHNSSYLTDAIQKADFDFYNSYLSGQKEMKPRWKRVLSTVSGGLGEAIGKLYVEKYFPADAKARMVELTNNLKKSLASSIQNLTWMSEETKKAALAKLEAMRVKVGYPDKWIDYSKLDIAANSYIENAWNASRFSTELEMGKVGKPVDKEEWVMTPQTVNAGYVPPMNEIIFPAAILQPPFFYKDADDAVNYGAIGVVIGHEMTHGFDDQGRKYDAKGNLVDWWTPADADKFVEKTQILVNQFNEYPILDSLRVNGKLTLGENIADNGGLNLSLRAFKATLKGDEKEIDGFTPMQRFFLSYAQVWRESIRDKKLMRDIKEDEHSPAEARVNRALFNINEFYDAFDIKSDAKLYIQPEQRASIW